ncbi:hypothetical protein F5Y19DRAFT_474492 [Xylariaceae sp. FL1651]|nr:hypothetical protein F5Y19DRAFT_474492 [Xylariaceae sp. FL1651]
MESYFNEKYNETSDPRWWGSDSLIWRPSRFIKPAGTESTAGGQEKSIENEEFLQSRRGIFVGWSEGARDCPDKKFSWVEFVATIASLFRDWRVDQVTFKGELIETARERVLDLIKTDSGMVLLQQMLHPEGAPLGLVQEVRLATSPFTLDFERQGAGKK